MWTVINAGDELARFGLNFTSIWSVCFALLAVTLLLSGLDDLIPVLICLRHWIRNRKQAAKPLLLPASSEPRRIAIFVPCWKEAAVIGNMVRHNLAAIRYPNYDFFLGTYPNDEATIREAQVLAQHFRNVHVAVNGRPGPTSKADCLNAIFRRMESFELETGAFFDTVVLHDAEDLIHPEALDLIHRERYEFEMVQVPVLPIATPMTEITHGVYCDEFAEFQTIDMHAREHSGSFVPSNGVGTGFAREILDRLAAARGDVFDADSLTEDYEIGVYAHAAGFRQKFAPLRWSEGVLVATREYFPRTVRAAIRQRTRWVTGIALQCWERRGWAGRLSVKYWFWRDRKGLVASPLSLLTNFLFLAGLADWMFSSVEHRPWMFAFKNPALIRLCIAMTGLQCLRLLLRMGCVARIFGLNCAMGVPLRVFHGNLINCFASLRALWRYAKARRAGRAHVWLKTEHAYPSHNALLHRREFSEVLLQLHLVTQRQLDDLLPLVTRTEDLGSLLLEDGLISEEDLCRARSFRAGVASGTVDTRHVKLATMRTLPRHVLRRYGILPVKVADGRLVVAGCELPEPGLFEELREFTLLPVEFQLVTRSNFEELARLA